LVRGEAGSEGGDERVEPGGLRTLQRISDVVGGVPARGGDEGGFCPVIAGGGEFLEDSRARRRRGGAEGSFVALVGFAADRRTLEVRECRRARGAVILLHQPP